MDCVSATDAPATPKSPGTALPYVRPRPGMERSAAAGRGGNTDWTWRCKRECRSWLLRPFPGVEHAMSHDEGDRKPVREHFGVRKNDERSAHHGDEESRL